MFPGAVATREEASYALIGAPLDVSTSYRPGTRFGPGQLREVARSFEDYDQHTAAKFTSLLVFDHGDIHPGGDTAEYLTFLSGTVSEYVRDSVVPLLVGGEHTVTVGGLRAVSPDVYVCLDAHLDLRESYAGNPLSHATVSHHALSHADEIYILGARSGSKAEFERAATTEAVTVIPPEAVADWEPSFSSESVYLSVDIDAADPGFAPGTGTPEPFGLLPRTMERIVRQVAPYCDGFDVVEVNDNDDGQTAVLGAKLLRSFVYAHAAGSDSA